MELCIQIGISSGTPHVSILTRLTLAVCSFAGMLKRCRQVPLHPKHPASNQVFRNSRQLPALRSHTVSLSPGVGRGSRHNPIGRDRDLAAANQAQWLQALRRRCRCQTGSSQFFAQGQPFYELENYELFVRSLDEVGTTWPNQTSRRYRAIAPSGSSKTPANWNPALLMALIDRRFSVEILTTICLTLVSSLR